MAKKISDLIKDAILAGNSRKGVSRVAIVKYISSKRTLSAATVRSISVVLKSFTQLGKLTKKKASYLVSKTWKNKTKKAKKTKKTKKVKTPKVKSAAKRTKAKKITKKAKVKKATKVKARPAKKKPAKKAPKKTPKKTPKAKPKPVNKRSAPKSTPTPTPTPTPADAPTAKRRADPKPKPKDRNEEAKSASDKPLKFDFDKTTIPVQSSPKLSYKWQYYDQKKAGGPWHDYDYGSSDIVEEAYQAWSANPAVDVAKIFSGEWHYMVDFNSMQQTNLDYNTHTVRKIRRVKA